MKALMCPKCQAKLQAEPGREYVFCSYCGDKILLRSILDIREEDTTPEKVLIDRKLEEADGLLRMSDYYRAEMIYLELIRDFPDYAIGYERMIRVYTRDYTIFRMDNKERIFSYMEKLLEVASGESEAEYRQLKERLETAVWWGEKEREETPKIKPIESGIFIATCVYLVSLFIMIIMLLFSKGAYFPSWVALVAVASALYLKLRG